MEKKEKEIMKTIKENINQGDNKYTLDLMNLWISNADSKINISCGISSLVVGAIGICAGSILGQMAQDGNLNKSIMVWFYIVTAFSICAFLASLWFYFWALNPNLTSGKSKIEKPKYSLFYKDISNFSNVDDYIECVEKATEEDFNRELIQEIYINASICTKKMERFKTGMWLSVIAIFGAVLACILFYSAIV